MPRRLYRVTLRPGEEGAFRKSAASLDVLAAHEADVERLAIFYQGAVAWMLLEGPGPDPARSLFEHGKTRKAAEAMAAHSDLSAGGARDLLVAEAFHDGAHAEGVPLAIGMRVLPGHEDAFREAAGRWPRGVLADAGAREVALYEGDGHAFLLVEAPEPRFLGQLVAHPGARAVLSDLDRHTDFELNDPERDALVDVRYAREASGAW